MLQLLERQIGADPNHIGFPSVETCMAVVVLTTSEIAGWHSLNTGDASTKANAQKFAAFIAANCAGAPLHLYVATNREVHARDWRAELINLADGLGYHGPATSIDLEVNVEGVYVQFERADGARTCEVSYKRNSKIDYESGKASMDVQAVRHRQLTGGAAGPGFDYIPSASGRTTVYTTVTTNAASAKGKLNSVGWKQRDTITIA